jgi:hypothetical protein
LTTTNKQIRNEALGAPAIQGTMVTGVIMKYMAVIFVVFLFGCSDSSTPQTYFTNNRTGNSIDYGVFNNKYADDHIITVHGFLDDHKVCREIVAMLEAQDGSYSCRALN